jgi:hypothetical protein
MFKAMDNALAAMFQRFYTDTIGISAGQIDERHIHAHASWLQGGGGSPQDFGFLRFRCLTLSLNVLALIDNTAYSPGTSSSFLIAMQPSIIPASTRVIDVELVAPRQSGTSNDAYFDAVSAWLTNVFSSNWIKTDVPIINGGAEIGTGTGWATYSGNPIGVIANGANTPAAAGNFYFFAGSGAANTYAQSFNILSLGITASDARTHYLVYGGKWSTNDDNDNGKFRFTYLDSAQNVIRAASCGFLEFPLGVRSYADCHWVDPIPTNAIWVQLFVEGRRNTGTELSFYFDSTSAYIMSYTPDLVVVASGGAVKRAFPNESAFRLFPLILNRTEPVV